MPRQKKTREVLSLPHNTGFLPLEQNEEKQSVVLTVDEYEAIRLIDKEGYSQEECGAYMKISRATAQRIHSSARKKMATALVEGRPLHIEGGEYQISDTE